MASCGFAHLSGDRVDQVQTIRQMSSVWLWEAVQRVLKATFEIFCIWRLCLRLWIEESPTSHIYERQPSWARHCRPLGYVPHKTKLVSRKRFVRNLFNKEIDLLTNQVNKCLAGLMTKERILCQGDWLLNFDAKYVWESFFEVNY